MLDQILQKAAQIEDPFEQSFFAMVHLPYLQPFIDVNKRTSRLAANLPLIRANLCPLTFMGVTGQAYSRAILGVYEMTRIELLRDLYVWAYQRSTQEYLSIKRDLVEPDPLRLAYRNLIRQTIHEVVTQPDKDALTLIQKRITAEVKTTDQANVQALVLKNCAVFIKACWHATASALSNLQHGFHASDFIDVRQPANLIAYTAQYGPTTHRPTRPPPA